MEDDDEEEKVYEGQEEVVDPNNYYCDWDKEKDRWKGEIYV